ncbi:MAG TPA: DUF5647 family protein [Candidatus Limnocylindrales bacterium]|jgi:hypothetical protein
MRQSDQAERNIDLAFDVIKQVLLQPDEIDGLEKLGGGATLVLFDPEDEALTAANAEMADRLEGRGERLVRAEVQRRLFLQPKH